MKNIIVNLDGKNVSLEGFDVIPSTIHSKFGDAYSECEIHSYTKDIKIWLENIKSVTYLEVVDFIEEFGSKFEHFALSLVFKMGTEKMYQVVSKKISKEDIEDIMNGKSIENICSSNIVLHGLYKEYINNEEIYILRYADI